MNLEQNMRNAAKDLPIGSADALRARQQADDFAATQMDGRILCEGVEREQTHDAWRYLHEAAANGSVAAMSKILRDPGLNFDDQATATDGWAIYKAQAPQLLAGAIQGGDVMALWFGATALSGLAAGGKEVFARDPYLAMVYGSAAAPLLDPLRLDQLLRRQASLTQELGPERALQASQEGAALRVKSFTGAKPTGDSPDDTATDVTDCAK